MPKSAGKKHKSRPILFISVVLLGLVTIITALLNGTNVAILNPKGFIAIEQRKLLTLCVLLLLEIAVPTLTIFYYVAWKYRETSNKTYIPQPHRSKSILFSIWAFPIITMVLIASVMWPAAHKLAPQKSIASSTKPMTIQVVAMRWKWLFIYPEQHIASVNFIQVPTDTPIQFDLTGDDVPMSSFWIPQLGGQLYAMTGHINRLNLMAQKPGDYQGSAAEINGDGFAGMKFITRAGTHADFDNWLNDVKNSDVTLDNDSYQELLKPSQNNPAKYYATVQPDLYDIMLMKYSGSHDHHTEGK